MAITLKNLQSKMNDVNKLKKEVTAQIDDYKINNQNSVYYLKPNSLEIALLDLKKRSFTKQQLIWPADVTNG